VTLKPGLGVTQGHRKLYYSIRPISHRFPVKRRFPSKIVKGQGHMSRSHGAGAYWRKSPIFPTPMYLTPPRWSVSLGIWYRYRRIGSQETRMIWLPDGRKSFSGIDTIPACDSHPASQSRCLSKHARYAYLLRTVKKGHLTPKCTYHSTAIVLILHLCFSVFPKCLVQTLTLIHYLRYATS